MLIDTGADRSTLQDPTLPTTSATVKAIGVGGTVCALPLTAEQTVQLGPLSEDHSFLIATSCPANLLGRDLLCKLRATITCSPEGLYLSVPTSVPEATVMALLATTPTAPFVPAELSDIPEALWASASTETGLLKSAEPVYINYRTDVPLPRKMQYPLPKEAIEGIRPVLQQLLTQGIIKEATSPCNTPILPVKKPKPGPDGKPVYRFVHDLRLINAIVIPRAPVVPNPATILTAIPPGATYFTVIDLSSAFFSIPVHPDSQFLFAFTFDGCQYVWTRLPQGYRESPTIFSQYLKRDLDSISLTMGSSLIQYVDDLLLCSTAKAACVQHTRILLFALAEKGHKVALSKLQFAQPEVEYLGHRISYASTALTQDRIESVLSMPRPTTKKQLRQLLGASGYCRAWIPAYAELVHPLTDLLLDSVPEPLPWTTLHNNALTALKQALTSAPALGRPDYAKPFTLFCHEQSGTASGVLTQPFGPGQRPVAYFSILLDPVAQGLPPCLRAVAAAAVLVEKASGLTLGHPLLVQVPHAIAALLNRGSTQHLTAARLTRYELALLANQAVTLRRCEVLNPATLLPLPEDGEPHNCLHVVDLISTPRPDLSDIPLQNPDLQLFCDGSACRDEFGALRVGYAIVTLMATLEAHALPTQKSAQAAELVALVRACQLAENKTVAIYTDSKYAFSVCHSTGQLWKHRGFLTSSGSQISHVALISALLEAIQLPAAVSVTHCKGHSRASDEVSKGNAAADSAARHAALCGAPAPFPFLAPLLLQPVTPAVLLSAQQTTPPAEVSRWKSIGCHLNEDNLYISPDGCPVLPRHLLPQVSQALHLASHLGKGGLVAQMEKLFFAPGVHAAAKTVTAQCELCQRYNHQGAVKPQAMGHCKLPEYPFAVVQMDFMDLPPVTGLKHLLVLVDLFSGWVEAFPTRRADAVSVAKCLLKEIVPRFGIMTRLESDQGPHFTSQIIQHLAKALGIKQALHTPYHPQSSGKVERVNGLIKTQLAKLCEQTGLKWPEVLPIVLTNLRNTPHRKHSLTPFEILFGRPLPIPLTSVDGFAPAKTSLMAGQDKLAGYCRMLQDALSDAWARVKDAQPLPLDTCAHSLFPGDFVCVKIHRRKHCLEPRWSAPAQVLLTTPTAVKVEGIDRWVHCSHCKKVPAPTSPTTPITTAAST
ncbi:unnamed protein product [Lepidochelys kempii]